MIIFLLTMGNNKEEGGHKNIPPLMTKERKTTILFWTPHILLSYITGHLRNNMDLFFLL